MRKLVVSALVSLDGVQGEPRSWASRYFDEDAAAGSLRQLQAADAMLMGRRTYEYFAPAWSTATGAYPDRINEMRKLVFSGTRTTVDWRNAELVPGNAVDTVRALKEQDGGDLVIYGFGRLSHSLLAEGLVDVLNLAVHPVVLGQGEGTFFAGPTTALTLSDVDKKANGVVSLTYLSQ